jgi:hypothetical protein
MATEVLTGYFTEKKDFTLYENNTGQNVRVIFNYLSIEGTGTSELRIYTPGQINNYPRYGEGGLILQNNFVGYLQIPNLPDSSTDYIQGIVGKQLSSSGLNYDWYYRKYWNFGKDKSFGGDNPNGYMFLTSEENVRGSSYNFFGKSENWWKKNGRYMEIPFPIEYYLKPNQSMVFAVRTKPTRDERSGSITEPRPQQITYNVLIMPEGGC